MKFSIEPFQKKIEKPWGYEIIITPESLARTGKILFVRSGKRLSLQYHDAKEETLCLLSGEAFLHMEDSEGTLQRISMQKDYGYTVVAGQKHRLEAASDAVILEVSSPEQGTTFRVEDDFARPDETENIRQAANRGWHDRT